MRFHSQFSLRLPPPPSPGAFNFNLGRYVKKKQWGIWSVYGCGNKLSSRLEYYTVYTDIFTEDSKESDIVFMVYFSLSQENIEKLYSEKECKLSSTFINIPHSQCTFHSILHGHISFSWVFFQKYFYATFLNNSYMNYISGQGLQMLFLCSCHLNRRSNVVWIFERGS